jgi:branched-subunit amino acid transport protein
VANDLVKPDTFASDPRGTLVLLTSSAVVLAVARKTGSLVWCAVVGMGVFAALGALVG